MKSLYLKDVADIKDTWSKSSIERYRKIKDQLMYNKQHETQDILFIANYVKDYVSKFNENNNDTDAKILFDASTPLKQRIDLLTKNGVIGFFLVLLFLTMFLHPRVSFGLP